MAKKNQTKIKSVNTKSNELRKWEFPLEKKNLLWLGIGVAVILIGYLLMSTGITEEPALVDGKWNNPLAVDVAPVVLVIGYCIIIPFAILKDFGKSKREENTES